MNEVKETGGAVIGGVRMIWPFATLIVTKDKLQLNGSIYGTFMFRPTDVDSIEVNGKFLNSGIKINHIVEGYNTNIIFLSRNSGELLDKIRQVGFIENQAELPKDVEKQIVDVQKNGAYPLKISVSIIILLILNTLILGNKFLLPGKYDEDIPFTGLELAFSFMIAISILLLIVKPFRRLMLKEGRDISSFRSFIYFTILLSAIMFLWCLFFQGNKGCNTMEIFYQQYEIVKGARQAMLCFIEKEAGNQLATPIKEFNNSTLGYLLVHIANTYKHWSANFPMSKGLPYTDENSVSDVETIQQLFAEADVLMMNFLDHFKDPYLTVTNKVRSGKTVTVTILELFTHMITHEFHHKGQIMTMCRLLGHVPPDTDAIRY